MKLILPENQKFTDGVVVQKNGSLLQLCIPAEGGGLHLPWLRSCRERYLSFYLTAEEAHSMSFELNLYADSSPETKRFSLRFGVLGNIKTFICIDLNWLDAGILFPEPPSGGLKMVCHGGRIRKEEIADAILTSLPCFHETRVTISCFQLTEEYPQRESLPNLKLIDCFGQNCQKDWTGKTHSEAALHTLLQSQLSEAADRYPFRDWSRFGGWKSKKLTKGTGFFSRIKTEKRWWLTDPDGYAFFSMGPDCVGAGCDCRIDGEEQWLDWLPDSQDPRYAQCFRSQRPGQDVHRVYRSFDYQKANLIRVFGTEWHEKWKTMISGQLRKYGLNTIGNWSDCEILGSIGIPYVTSLPEFPSTKISVFRDFPDVFSEEYKINARRCALELEKRKNDPWMIGYFLRNEPAWAFVDNLILADEVLYNPQNTCCRENLIARLKEKYHTVDALNQAWNTSFSDFSDLYRRQESISSRSPRAMEDMRAFSREMVRAYIEIPSAACRSVDPNHMILGMRWAWISDPDLVTGWENFDVFSINCYAVDPTDAIQNIVEHRVDLPVMIGEFHFGALDAGLTATGLEGVASQKERGTAYRYYCERAAAHPNGVGCHYFQCYDQFMLGRFDGENYNIGLFDICCRPYSEMLEQVKNCSSHIYEIADGTWEPTKEKPESIPMIAY